LKKWDKFIFGLAPKGLIVNLSEKIHSQSRENNFNLIRFIAATFVFVHHSFALSATPLNWVVAATLSQAVPIFITISGFLVAKSWSESPRLLPFVIKRFLRIFPALLFSTLLSVFIIGPLVTTLPLDWYFRHPLTITYLKNVVLFPLYYAIPGVFQKNPYPFVVNGSLWTLPIEVFLYAVLAILGISGILLKRYFIAAVLISLVCIEALYGDMISSLPMLFQTIPLTNLLNLSIFFFIGCLYYILKGNIRLNNKFTLVAVILLFISFKLPFGENLASYILLPYIVIQFAYMDYPSARLFRKNDLSYGLYIYAFPLQQTAIYFLKDTLPMYELFPLAFFVLLLCSYLSWKFVEHPALQLKRWRSLKWLPSLGPRL
jgi:peptidoglycan/LPS O-acetylase OafA/YrhL